MKNHRTKAEPTYFWMAHNVNRYVSWDGNATFQTGRFDGDGSFVPSGYTIYLGAVRGPCTEQEAWEVAERVYRDEEEMMREAAIEDGPAGEDEEDSLEGCTVCPVCLCSGIRLGTLGDKTHFRCRGCGINFYAGITLAD